jgi:hypothetical protein
MHAYLPSSPGAIIGYTRRGPIRVQAGGSEDAAPATDAPAPTEQASTEPPKPAPPATDAKAEPKTFDADYVRKLRDEAASNRVKSKELEDQLTAAQQRQQEQMDAIAKALGLKEDDAPPNPEELTKQLTAAQQQAQERDAELRTLRVERAAEKAARAHDADVDALLDSRAFTTKLAKLDPTDDGFAAALDELVKTTVDSNPKYKATGPAPTASSADFSSGTGEQRKRPTSLFSAVSNRYGGQ